MVGWLTIYSTYQDADDGDDDDDDLFDSDEEQDDNDGDDHNDNTETPNKKKVSKLKKKSSSSSSPSSSSPTKTLSKRERMEALRARKRALLNESAPSKSKKKRKPTDGTDGNADATGYQSGDSYDSATYLRTQEDDDFIDTQGEDEEAVREYYAEQHFEDERPDDLEEMELKPRKKGSSSSAKKRGPDQLSAEDKKDKDNPIMMAVERMKKKKRVARGYEVLKSEAIELIEKMNIAARDDDISRSQKKPGLKKLQLLSEVLDTMVQQDIIRELLDHDFLIAVKKWIQPLENGSLGNVTLRSKLIDGIANMNGGDKGIDNDDLKRSDFGKVVMNLYMHKKETPTMKRKLKALIEQWSRRIFHKSGDMKNLGSSNARMRSEGGLVGINKAQAAQNASQTASMAAMEVGKNEKDLGSILAHGVKQARDLGRNRVRVPYSKGFQYSVRPENKSGDVADKKTRVMAVNDQRDSLHRRMMDKKKKATKNSRSANMSIEGRPTK